MPRGSGSWLVCVPFLLTAVLGIDKYIQDADRFPGWKGELPKAGQPGVELAVGEHGKVYHHVLPAVAFHMHTVWKTMPRFAALQDHWTGEVIELSWEPRAFLFKKFMTDQECDHLIEKVSYCMTCSADSTQKLCCMPTPHCLC